MALGVFTDENLVDNAVLSGGTWSAALPLANLKGGDYIARPARCEDTSNLAKTQFQAALEFRRPVTVVAVLFHTFSRAAKYRVTVSDFAGGFAAPDFQSDWLDVTPRLHNSADLPWEAPNWWLGQPLDRELDLYPRHLWIVLPAGTLVTAVRVELDDRDNTAGYIDAGGLWIADGWSPACNFERGRQLSAEGRALLDEAPSGRLYSEERQTRRVVSAEWRGLKALEADRLFDAGMRCGITRPVLFIPDLDDPASLLREAFPATFSQPPTASYLHEGLHQVPAVFKEIIA